MSSGADRAFYGSFTGTGVALEVANVGFRPKSVELFNRTAPAKLVWTESMPDLGGMKTVTAGTNSVLTTTGITPTATGFTLGADADLNTAAEVVDFIARG